MSWVGEPPIVVFGDDWGRHVSSMQHLLRCIVPRRRVVWVNGLGHRVPELRAADLRRAWTKGRAMLAQSQRRSAPASALSWDGVRPAAVLEPRVLPWHHRALVQAFNAWSLERAIRRALAALGNAPAPIVVTGSPPSVAVLGRLRPALSVYFCMDDFLHLPGVSAEMLGPLEQRLLAQVDAVVATAQSLTRSKRPSRGRAYYLPQGVNYDHFAAPQPIPRDLEALPRPRIGFAGALSDCCDWAALRAVADANPSGSVVLVGPVTASRDIGPELGRPNIHLLGPRPYAQLPAYVQHLDVGLIPYVLNAWTDAVDPLKLLEYLAAGLPVVSTRLPEVLKYQPPVRVAETEAEFVALVRSALAEPRATARECGQAVARAHTWERRAETFLGILAELSGEPRAARAEAFV